MPAVYPAVNEVLAGVIYGPAGNDYTGTLVVPTVAQIATAVWQDATAGDFTVAHSIGKALYIDNVAPGGAGGFAIVGSLMGLSAAAITLAKFDGSTAFAQTGDAYGIVSSGTFGNAALLTAIQAVLPGSGTLTKVYTVTDSSTGLPIAGVNVRVTTDIAGFNTVATGTTNASGEVTFYLDAGTYYLWRTHSLYGFTNPDTETAP